MLYLSREVIIENSFTYEDIAKQDLIFTEVYGGYYVTPTDETLNQGVQDILHYQKYEVKDFTELNLRSNKENKKDCFAVEVWLNKIPFGYLSKKICKYIIPKNWICLKCANPEDKKKNHGTNIMLINKVYFEKAKLEYYKKQAQKIFIS